LDKETIKLSICSFRKIGRIEARFDSMQGVAAALEIAGGKLKLRRTTMSNHRDPIDSFGGTNPFAAMFQEIADIAQAELRRSSYFELRDIACDFSGGILTLRGRVPSYHLKQLAQATVAEVPGVIEVHNQVEVVMPHRLHNSGWRENEMLAAASTG
jgi:osmotically-inducible protein OsmY